MGLAELIRTQPVAMDHLDQALCRAEVEMTMTTNDDLDTGTTIFLL